MNNSSIKDWAAYYGSLGLRVLPLTPKSKRPQLKTWTNKATADEAQIGAWWTATPGANIGVVMGAGIVDIESDAGENGNGEDSLAEWEKQNSPLPVTWCFRSGGGGIHRLYRTGVQGIRNRVSVLPYVDIRGENGFAVFPPSLHPNGTRYEWLPGCSPKDIPEPAPLTFELLSLLLTGTGSASEPLEIPEEIPDGGRNATLFRAACKLRSSGLSFNEILAAIRQINVDRCCPPLEDEDEVELICRQAARYKPGELMKGARWETGGFEVFSAAELEREQLGETRYIVVDLLPQGLTLLTSPPKFGKSWLVLDLCLSVTSGGDFLGHRTERCGCLYMALEDSKSRLKGRMRKLLRGAKVPDNFDLAINAPDLSNGLIETLDNYMSARPQTGLIVIDTLQKIRGEASRTESAYKYDYREVGQLKAFADRHGILLLLVHHLRKMKDDEDPHNRISGTNGIMGAADTSMVLTKEKRIDETATLSVTGRDIESSDTVLQFNKESCKWYPLGSAEAYAEQKALLSYRNDPIVMTVCQLVEQGGGIWRGTMSELMNAGRELVGVNLADSPLALLHRVKKLEPVLFDIGKIIRNRPGNGSSGGGYHYFRRMLGAENKEENQ